MPRLYTRSFRIRSYECDAHGHLNNANYLRLMQETAFDASSAAGYDLQRYEEMGRIWLIRETNIEFIIPLHYNETIDVKTWVADFRRVSSRRAYEFLISGTQELAACAYTDWAFLDTTTNQPTRIPPEMFAAFYPEGVPDSFPARQPFPEIPPQPPGVFSMRRQVVFSDIDTMQHVNNARYLDFISECGMEVLSAHGWPWRRIVGDGFAIFLRRLRIQYLQPALLDDELEIYTWASEIRRATAIRHYTIHRADDQATLARAYTYAIWVDIENGRPIRIPENFLADFTPNIVD